MKKKWRVVYWNFNTDKKDWKCFDLYEDAITHKHKMMKKFNSHNVRVELNTKEK